MKPYDAMTILTLLGLAAVTTARAECPNSLPVDLLMDCIVVEGAGDEYPAEERLAAWEAEHGRDGLATRAQTRSPEEMPHVER